MRVFLSHRTGSDAGTARRLATDLEARGIRTWLAPRDVDPGTTWPQAIENGLQSSTHVAILISRTTLESRPVQQELQMAEMLHLEGKVDLLPVLLEDTTLPPWLAVVQYVDFRGSYAEGLAALTRKLGSVSEAATSVPGGTPGGLARAASPVVHRAVTGDRIDLLAHRLLGDVNEWRRLLAANPHLNSLRLRPGTPVFVPRDGREDAVQP